MVNAAIDSERPKSARSLFVASLAASAALLLLLAAPLVMGRIYVADDLGEFHLPARAFYAQCLAGGESFDWWPQLFGGVYLTGEGQVGSYHPLHLLLYSYLPLPAAFGLEVWLNYPFLLLGTYLWLRRRLGRREAAIFGALVFTFSGFNLLHIVHVNAIAVVAHIPWLLWVIDVAVTHRGRHWKAVAGLSIALLTASQILLGYPQYVWFSLLIEAAYLSWLVWKWRPRRTEPWGALSSLLVAKLLGITIGAVQWLPTLDALQGSVRDRADADFAAWGSLHPLNLVQLVAPYLFETRVVGQNTHELGLYVGAVPLTLVFWMLLNRRSLGPQRRAMWGGMILAIFALVMALGSYGYVYHAQTWLPIVGRFRFPCRMIVVFHLAVAILAAIAIGMLVGRQSEFSKGGGRRAPMSLVVASTVVALLGCIAWHEHVAGWPYVLVGPLLFLHAAWLVAQAERKSQWALIGLVLLTAVDLGAYGLSYAAYPWTARFEDYAHVSGLPAVDNKTRIAADVQPPGRRTSRVGNRMLLAGHSRIEGYLGLEPLRQLDYRAENALRAAGVGWVRSAAIAKQAEAATTNQFTYQPINDPVPHVRLVTRVAFSDNPAADIERIDVATTALVDDVLELPAADTGKCHVAEQAPGRLTIRTETTTRQLLVVAQSFHDGWTATIDRHPENVWRVNGDFVGCVVPAGAHEVQLSFRPASLRSGKRIAACGLGLLVCGFLSTFCGLRPVGFRWNRTNDDERATSD